MSKIDKDNRTGCEWVSKDGTHIIMGGGKALDGAPESWEWAKGWKDKVNEEACGPVRWSWDCHFKLDYDGELCSISSRFYPPAQHCGSKWDGRVCVYWRDRQISKREFVSNTLDGLRTEVESYCNRIADKIGQAILGMDFSDPPEVRELLEKGEIDE